MEAKLKHDLPWVIGGAAVVGALVLVHGAPGGPAAKPLSPSAARKAGAPYVIGGQKGAPATSYSYADTGGQYAEELVAAEIQARQNEYDANQQTTLGEYVSHQALSGLEYQTNAQQSEFSQAISAQQNNWWQSLLGNLFNPGNWGQLLSGFFGFGGLGGAPPAAGSYGSGYNWQPPPGYGPPPYGGYYVG